MSSNHLNFHSEPLNSLLKDSLLYCCPALQHNNSIVPARQESPVQTQAELGHIMLTVSGLDFRAAVFLHFQAGEHARQAYQLLNASERIELSDLQFQGFYTELGNHLCGRIKSYFHHDFTHLGMSTPWIMSSTTDLVDLTAPHLTGFGQVFFCLNTLPIVGASLYVYSSKALIFSNVYVETQEQHNSGELEFF